MENKPASSLVVSLGKALNKTFMWKTGGPVFPLNREGWCQEGYLTVKQMPCYKNAGICSDDP